MSRAGRICKRQGMFRDENRRQRKLRGEATTRAKYNPERVLLTRAPHTPVLKDHGFIDRVVPFLRKTG